MKSTVMATIGAAALALLGPGSGLGSAGERRGQSVGVGAEAGAADARHSDDRRRRDQAGRGGQRAHPAAVRRRAGPGHSQVRDAGRGARSRRPAPGPACSGASSCSTPTASTRWPRLAASCTSRAARCRSSRARRSWPACSGTRSSTSPRSTPSRRSRRARWCRSAPTRQSAAAGVFNKLVDKATGVVMAGFGRDEELEADRKGIVIANTVGYNPNGLKDFLTTLADRNKASTEKQGLFASHPEMKERFDKLDDTVKTSKLTATATVEARYKNARHLRAGRHHRDCDRREGLGGPCRWRLRQGGRHGQGRREGRRQGRGAEEEARVRSRPADRAVQWRRKAGQ